MSLPFEVRPNDGFTYVVTNTDGKRYQVTVRLAVASISDTGMAMVKPDGTIVPQFNLNAQIIMETTPLDAPDTAPAVVTTTVNTGKKSMN